ncbi:MAG TPA: glucoamylase family protein [Verrucomicrobiota bacterium]|nr:glucoamylase family protein [Verrucomicrobiota bacterium]HNT14283.1 glucoamylase family protein [Verrucomicrobiota bacterium]
MSTRCISRRELLQKLGWTAPLLLTTFPVHLPAATPAWTPQTLTTADHDFLEELARTTFEFFKHNTHPETGLVRDRCRVHGEDSRAVASISATGFGLTALCVADRRGWLKRGEAASRVRTALRFLWQRMPQEHGFFYHFVNWRNGEREWNCELSSIDSALLLCGVLTCRQYFEDREIRRLARALYERMDWEWMLNGGTMLSHGWKPESGFLTARWNAYCEHMLLYLLAIGASRQAIPASTWEAWQRPEVVYRHFRYISPREPLFVHQYSHAWFNFHGRRDRHADYWNNSVIATQAHQAFCADLAHRWPHYSSELWGISASDSPAGYIVWGGPPELGPLDGSLVPCAAAGSLPFLPEAALRCLRQMRQRFGDQSWTRFGFADAFNPATGWVGPDIIGNNAGIALIMAENLRSGLIWEHFMRNPEAQRAMKLVHFREA